MGGRKDTKQIKNKKGDEVFSISKGVYSQV